MLAFAFALAAISALISGWAGQISATTLTALGCLAVGAALARLIPRRWFVLGVLGMRLADVALLASGIVTSAALLMSSASADVHGPAFSQADIAGSRPTTRTWCSRRCSGDSSPAGTVSSIAAVLVAVLGAAYGIRHLPVAHLLPATVPIGLALLMLESPGMRAEPLVGHEQPPLHLLFRLRVELPQPLELSA